MKVGVIGAGAVGSATARFLTKAGHHATLFEQFHLDHDRGSSHGPSRIIRRTYPDFLYTQMMDEAYRLWDALEEEISLDLRLHSGGIYFGAADHPSIMASIDSLERAKVDYERLDCDQASERFPMFRFRDGEVAIYQEDMGILNASDCVKAQIGLAREQGAYLKETKRVTALRFEQGEVIVSTDDGDEFAFDRLAITAGPWMTRLVDGAPLPLNVTRQQQLYFQPPVDTTHFQIHHCPVWIDAETEMYGFPMHEDAPGVKVASNAHGDIVDPDVVSREVSEVYIQAVHEYLSTRLPELNTSVAFSKVCLYTMAPDHDFVIDAAPNLPNTVFASACSGHGFKFSILIGKILSEMLTDSLPASRSLDRFKLSRFAF